jgi:beta-lactamase regulating signal transducer with metallopeptidase domain
MSLLMLFARGAVVLAFALIALRLLRRSSASLRYAVLATAVTGVLVLPAIELLLPTWHTGALPVAAVSSPITPELPVAETGGVAVAAEPILVRPADLAIPWSSLVVSAWLLVSGLLLLRVVVGAIRARGIAARGTSSPVDAREVWVSLAGRGASPRIVESTEIESPIVVGAIRPVVVVPRTASSWSAERWRVVLLHELAHVRQHDGLVNLIAQLACCLHWINPLVWIAARRLREERELAADDAVLHAGARASCYAEHLFAIAAATPHGAPVSVLAMATPSRFESRMVALLDADRPRRAGLHRALAAITTVALLTAGVACVSPDQPPPPADVVASPKPPTSTIDAALQTFAEAELDRALTTHRATGAIAIVLDAKTGTPLAIASRGDGNPRAIRAPGSTIKPFTIAAALEAGTVDPTTKLDCENGTRSYGTRTLRDQSANGMLDLGGILAVSSNVCIAKLAEPLGDGLGESFRRYRLSAPARIDTRSFEGASIANGEGLQLSALDVASAYTAFANAGIHHAPDGTGMRMMRDTTARAVLDIMERVTVDPRGTGHAARIDGIRVAGKTGTARTPGTDTYYASFVGIAPSDAPRVIVLVGFEGVTTSGGKVAAPVFSTIATRALAR